MQEVGDKEQQVRQEEASLEEAEREQKSLEARRNALNDERKELWRAENEAENSIGKIHGNRQKAEKKVELLSKFLATWSLETAQPFCDWLISCHLTTIRSVPLVGGKHVKSAATCA